MLETLLICCSASALAAFGTWLGFKGVNRTLRREVQEVRDDVDHLASRFERELKVRAANRSV